MLACQQYREGSIGGSSAIVEVMGARWANQCCEVMPIYIINQLKDGAEKQKWWCIGRWSQQGEAVMLQLVQHVTSSWAAYTLDLCSSSFWALWGVWLVCLCILM